jgi:hypothetical protein
MLVATRDPMHSPGTHDGAPRPRPTASHATRFVAAMQIAGSVMAIPVGLGTAYSLYRTNFSVDTTCQALRANIISMIDKKIDATARRMLVRHDVETFEKTCGGVDPDAEAAFKTLLAAQPPARPVAAPVKAEAAKRAVEAPKADPKAEAKEAYKPDLRAAVPAEPVKERREVVREPAKESPKEIAREPVKEPVKEIAKATEVPAQQADARWLDAVRGALVAHEAKAATAEAVADVAVTRGAPPHPLALPPPPVAAVPVASAPALPPPTQVAEPVRAEASAAPADPDRPVPPGSIPEQSVSKPAGWVSHVPFVGQMLAK